MEDALAVHFTGTAEARDFFTTSTLIPMLASVAAILNDEDALSILRGLAPQLEGVTLERWYPTRGIERFTGTQHPLYTISVSRVLDGLQPNAAAETEASLRLPANAVKPEDLTWHGKLWHVLIALSARLHRHPLPTWYLASSPASAAQDAEADATAADTTASP